MVTWTAPPAAGRAGDAVSVTVSAPELAVATTSAEDAGGVVDGALGTVGLGGGVVGGAPVVVADGAPVVGADVGANVGAVGANVGAVGGAAVLDGPRAGAWAGGPVAPHAATPRATATGTATSARWCSRLGRARARSMTRCTGPPGGWLRPRPPTVDQTADHPADDLAARRGEVDGEQLSANV